MLDVLLSGIIISCLFFLFFSQHIFYSIFFLILIYFFTFPFFIFYQFDFLGVLFLLVYVGAVLILFLFVIMVLPLNLNLQYYKRKVPTLFKGFYLFFWFGVLHNMFTYFVSDAFNPVEHKLFVFLYNDLTNIQTIGCYAYVYCGVDFILLSFVLLVSMMGVILILKKNK